MDQAIGLGWGARKCLSLLELACAVHLRRRGKVPEEQEAFREMGHRGASSSSGRVLSKSGGAPGNPRVVADAVSDQMNTHRSGTRQIKVVGRFASGDVQNGCVWSRAILSVHDWDMELPAAGLVGLIACAG